MAETDLIRVEKVDEALLLEVIKRILSIVDPIRIILFGSWATGTADHAQA